MSKDISKLIKGNILKTPWDNLSDKTKASMVLFFSYFSHQNPYKVDLKLVKEFALSRGFVYNERTSEEIRRFYQLEKDYAEHIESIEKKNFGGLLKIASDFVGLEYSSPEVKLAGAYENACSVYIKIIAELSTSSQLSKNP